MDANRRRPENLPSAGARARHLPQRGKMKPVVYNGKQLYQWDQTPKQVFIEIMAPPPNSSVFCNISENYLQLGAHTPKLPTTWYLNHDTGGPVNKEQSYWKNGKETCKIVLTKANPGIHWRIALKDDRDDMRREQQKSRLPAASLRPTEPREHGQVPIARQQQRLPPASSRSPSPGRRMPRPVKQDPPTAPNSSNPIIRSPLGLVRKPQQQQQKLQQNTPARSVSPGRRRARPVSAKTSAPVRAKSTSAIAEQQKPATRDPLPGRRKSTLVAAGTRTSPVKAKSVRVLSPSQGQQQQQTRTTKSQSPERRKERPAKKDPSSNTKSTTSQPSQLSRTSSPGRARTRSEKENVPSRDKDKSTNSFVDRFKASKEGQHQNGQQSKVSPPPPQAHQNLSLDNGKPDLPAKSKKRTVSFRSPPRDYGKEQQKRNQSKASRISSSGRRDSEPTKDDSSSPAKTPPKEYRQGQQDKQLRKTPRHSSPGKRNAKPAKSASPSPAKTRSSSSRSPLAVIPQRQHNELEQQRPRKKSQQYATRPKSPSPERRSTKAAKSDPPSKARSSKRALANANQPKKRPTASSNERAVKAIVQQPAEIKSIGRGKPRSSSAIGVTTAEKQLSPTELVHMQKIHKRKEDELKSRELEIRKLNRKINKLEDIIATRRHQDKSRNRRNQDMALTADDLEDQLKQSKSEHQHELSRLEKANRRITAELDKQTALVQSMEEELAKTQTKMDKTRRLSIAQDREIEDRESWIESLQSQLHKRERRGDTHENDQITAELQKQIHRVETMKQVMKEYKRRWKEQRQFSDMQTQQIREKQSFVNSLTAKLESADRRVLELEHELKLDQVEIVAAAEVLTKSQRHLEELQREHKQALEKIRSLESELRQQWQDWNEMEENMADAQAQMAWLLEDPDYSDRYHKSLAKEAIRELIESRPDGKAERRINQLESELEEQHQDWKELEDVLDSAQTKIASNEQQLRPKKLSDYTIPDAPLASVNEHLDRLAVKMVSARNQLEEVQRLRLPYSQRRTSMVAAK